MHATLVLVRRGRLEPQEDQKALGQSDPTLGDEGVRAEKPLIARLARLRPVKVLASDLLRSRVTAERFGLEHDLPVTCRRDLREQRLGRWQGRRWAEILESDAERAVPFLQNFTEATPPGGETLERVQARTVHALLAECRRHRREVLVHIGHAGPIRSFLAAVLGISLLSAQRLELSPFGTSVVRLIGRTGIVESLNVPLEEEDLGALPH